MAQFNTFYYKQMAKQNNRSKSIKNVAKVPKSRLQKNKKQTRRRTNSIQLTINQGKKYEQDRKLKEDKKNRELRRKAASQKPKNIQVNKIKKANIKAPLANKIASDKVQKVQIKPIKNSIKKQGKSSKKQDKVTTLKATIDQNLPIPAFGTIDICFCIDSTGSMGSYLQQAKTVVQSIIKRIQSKVQTQGIQLRFAVVSYRDHPPQQMSYVTQLKDFTDNHQIRAYIASLNAAGGGDEPEAVHDGLLDCANKLSWRNVGGFPTLRYIFHIADAPPHGKQFLTGQSQEGCTCGKTTQDIIRAINSKQIHYRLIKVGSNAKVDQMQMLFQKGILNMNTQNINNAKQMDIKVSDMIIRELIPQ